MYHLQKYNKPSDRSLYYGGKGIYISPHVGYLKYPDRYEDKETDPKVEYDSYNKWKNEPLTFEIRKTGTLVWGKTNSVGTTSSQRTAYYSKNGGPYTEIRCTSTVPYTLNVSTGDILKFKATNSFYADSTQNSFGFNGTSQFDLSGNIMSMIDSADFENLNTITKDYCFQAFFKGSGVLCASNLILPATTISNCCYTYLFENCSSLYGPPILPATTLGESCYKGMFKNCTNLKIAPNLPATELPYNCYNEMFYGCTTLENGPLLPAPKISSSPYNNMFSGCTNLKYLKVMNIVGELSLSGLGIYSSNQGTLVLNTLNEYNYTAPSGWTILREPYQSAEINLAGKYIKTNLCFVSNDHLYCKFKGKNAGYIVGANLSPDSTANNFHKFSVYVDENGQLFVKEASGTSTTETVTSKWNDALIDGENILDLNCYIQASWAYTLNGQEADSRRSTGCGTNTDYPLYIHAVNKKGEADENTVFENDFFIEELKITDYQDNLKLHLIPITYYGRKAYLDLVNNEIYKLES